MRFWGTPCRGQATCQVTLRSVPGYHCRNSIKSRQRGFQDIHTYSLYLSPSIIQYQTHPTRLCESATPRIYLCTAMIPRNASNNTNGNNVVVTLTLIVRIIPSAHDCHTNIISTHSILPMDLSNLPAARFFLDHWHIRPAHWDTESPAVH